MQFYFFFSSRRRHTRFDCDWSSDVCSSDLGQMKPGDRVLVYHTGDEKAVVGVAEVASEAYPDPRHKDAKLAVVDLTAGERLPRPVPLAEIKRERAFADLALVRIGRLSVMPASAEQYKRLLALGGAK